MRPQVLHPAVEGLKKNKKNTPVETIKTVGGWEEKAKYHRDVKCESNKL